MFQYFWQKLLDEQRRHDAKSEDEHLGKVGNRNAAALLHQELQIAGLALGVRRISGAVKGREK